MEGDPAGSRSQVKKGGSVATFGRQPLPDGKVGRVRAALGVVPDDGGPGRRGGEGAAHRQNSETRPRFESMVRSSISAV